MMDKNTPASLKSIAKYVVYADELANVQPLESYYCTLFAAQRAAALLDKSDKSAKMYVSQLLDKCEERQAKIQGDKEQHRAQFEQFALSVFQMADDEDLSGNADKSTAKRFYAASTFLEVCGVFGELPSDLLEKRRYAMKKTSLIQKALREGRTPEPGIPGFNDAPVVGPPPPAPLVEPESNANTVPQSDQQNESFAQRETAGYPGFGGGMSSNQPFPYAPAPEYGYGGSPSAPPPASSMNPYAAAYGGYQLQQDVEANNEFGSAPPAETEEDSTEKGSGSISNANSAGPFGYPPPMDTNKLADHFAENLNYGGYQSSAQTGSVYPTFEYNPKPAAAAAPSQNQWGQQDTSKPVSFPNPYGAIASGQSQSPQAKTPASSNHSSAQGHAATAPSNPSQTPVPAVLTTPNPSAAVVGTSVISVKEGYTAGFKELTSAQRHAKFAASALDFQDTACAIKELKEALKLLTGRDIA